MLAVFAILSDVLVISTAISTGFSVDKDAMNKLQKKSKEIAERAEELYKSSGL